MSNADGDKLPTKVLDFLYIGNRHHAKNRAMLKELKVVRVLNCTPPRSIDPNAGLPNFFEKDRDMTYKRVPIFDNRGEDVLSHLDGAASFIEQGKFYGAVLVHCQKGVSRSASVVLGFLMKSRGLSFDEAFAYLKGRRAVVNPHEAFVSQLQQYEEQLRAEWAKLENPPQFPNDLLPADVPTDKRIRGPSLPARPPGPGAPVGQSIGPARPPQISSAGGPSSIGPALPPQSHKGAKRARSPDIGPASAVGPQQLSPQPAAPPLGPEMAPHASRAANGAQPPATGRPTAEAGWSPVDGSKDLDAQRGGVSDPCAIGPLMPPGLGSQSPLPPAGSDRPGSGDHLSGPAAMNKKQRI